MLLLRKFLNGSIALDDFVVKDIVFLWDFGNRGAGDLISPVALSRCGLRAIGGVGFGALGWLLIDNVAVLRSSSAALWTARIICFNTLVSR